MGKTHPDIDSATALEALAEFNRFEDAGERENANNSWKLLHHLLSGFLLFYARLFFRDEHTAQDVVQDVFLKLFNHRHDEFHNLRAWLLRVLRNLCIDIIKERGRFARLIEPIDANPCGACEQEPSDGVESQERSEQVRDALRKLWKWYPDSATILEMRYMRDLDATKIAKALGITVGAVGVRLTRARAHLREIIGNDLRIG